MTSTLPSPSAGQEREAFEEHYAKIWKERTFKDESIEQLMAVLVTMRDDDDYDDGNGTKPIFINTLWQGWQARAALTSASKQEEEEPVAYLVTNLPSGEPSLCFKDEMGDYGDEDHMPVFTPLGALSAPQPPLAGAGEAEKRLRGALIGVTHDKSYGCLKERTRDEVDRALKAAQPIRMCECGTLPHTNSCSWEHPNEPKPAPLNGGCGDGEREHG